MPNTLRKSERMDKKKVIEKMSCKCFETPFQAGGEAQPRETPDT